MIAVQVRGGQVVSGGDPCPTITVRGRAFCLDRTCWVRREGGKCPPAAPINAEPDFVMGWRSLEDCRKAIREGRWDSHIVCDEKLAKYSCEECRSCYEEDVV